jgi:hypothetical protein
MALIIMANAGFHVLTGVKASYKHHSFRCRHKAKVGADKSGETGGHDVIDE